MRWVVMGTGGGCDAVCRMEPAAVCSTSVRLCSEVGNSVYLFRACAPFLFLRVLFGSSYGSSTFVATS